MPILAWSSDTSVRFLSFLGFTGVAILSGVTGITGTAGVIVIAVRESGRSGWSDRSLGVAGAENPGGIVGVERRGCSRIRLPEVGRPIKESVSISLTRASTLREACSDGANSCSSKESRTSANTAILKQMALEVERMCRRWRWATEENLLDYKGARITA